MHAHQCDLVRTGDAARVHVVETREPADLDAEERRQEAYVLFSERSEHPSPSGAVWACGVRWSNICCPRKKRV